MAVERRRSSILTAGAVLAIISGALGIIGGLFFAIAAASGSLTWEVVHNGVVESGVLGAEWIPLGIAGIILGVLAVLGGRYALRMQSFGWALTGGICALLVAWLLGLLALIFIALSRREFAE